MTSEWRIITDFNYLIRSREKIMEQKKQLKKYGLAFLCFFTFIFMVGIFGPTEIFFGNYAEIGVIYREFGLIFLGAGLVISLIGALAVSFLPEVIFKGMLGLITGVNIAAYVQSMFFNKNIGLVGVSAEGYVPDAEWARVNLIIWIIIILGVFGMAYVKQIKALKLYSCISLFMLLVQGVAFGTLFLSVDKSAFEYAEGDLTFDMSEQLMVSGEENIIFLVFDTVPNTWFEETAKTYPEIYSIMQDFTYYNNAECNYFGTYPSMVHMLTGNPFNPLLKTDDWFFESWNNEKTNAFYGLLQSKDYKINIYPQDPSLVVGWNTSLEMIQDKVSNIYPKNSVRSIDYAKLYNVLLRLSAFRYSPDNLKKVFHVGESEYSGIVSYPDNSVLYKNSSFYKNLIEKELTIDEDSNYFIFKHFNGAHEYVNDEECNYLENATRQQTVRGIFTLVGEYLTQLQEKGVYDNSTIIVLTDHGISIDTQPIFFIKHKNESHDEMQVSKAPIDYTELLPTIVEVLGEEHSAYGQSIYDIDEDEVRERFYYERALDEEFPKVWNSTGEKMVSSANIWRKYIYAGDRKGMQKVFEKIYEKIPMTDSYY